MDITELKKHKEAVAAKVHDAWWDEKKNQGFHPPIYCTSQSAKDAKAQDIRSYGHNEFPKFHKFCDQCHTDMYPYDELPENVKDYDRVTVEAVLKAISEI
jgi:hypothetical protein